MSNARELAELSGSYGTGGFVGMKNSIINGAMMIDQRNAGASVTPTDGQYTLDRFTASLSQSSKFSIQQSSTAPVGFTKSLKVTSASAYSVASGDYFGVQQKIEGFNVSDLNWGTANANTVTLSFQVYSSLTGTFGGCVYGGQYYPFTYTISSANTWTTVSVTIVGSTSGTWNTNSSTGVSVFFGLGVGSTYSGTAGTWSNTFYLSATGATSIVGTSGATFYITGVQLEKGSTATSFNYRPYGTELALCQRYYQKSYNQAVVPAAVTPVGMILLIPNGTAGTNYCQFTFPVLMRTAPTLSHWDGAGNAGAASKYVAGAWTNNIAASVAGANIGESGYSISFNGGPFTTGQPHGVHYSASAEL